MPFYSLQTSFFSNPRCTLEPKWQVLNSQIGNIWIHVNKIWVAAFHRSKKFLRKLREIMITIFLLFIPQIDLTKYVHIFQFEVIFFFRIFLDITITIFTLQSIHTVNWFDESFSNLRLFLCVFIIHCWKCTVWKLHSFCAT